MQTTMSFVTKMASFAVVGFLALTGGAQASDPTPRPYCGGLFHGFYAGANVGYVVDTTSWSDRDFWLTGTGYTHTQSGVSGGVQAGYNHRCGNMVVGVEADWNWTGVSSDEFYQARQAELKYELSQYGTVRGRIGMAMDPLLLYVTSGIAFGAHKHEFINVADHVGKTDSTRIGFVVGGGAEWALNDWLTLRGEALYVNLGTDDYNSHPRVGFGNTFKFDVSDEFWVGRLGFNVKLK